MLILSAAKLAAELLADAEQCWVVALRAPSYAQAVALVKCAGQLRHEAYQLQQGKK